MDRASRNQFYSKHSSRLTGSFAFILPVGPDASDESREHVVCGRWDLAHEIRDCGYAVVEIAIRLFLFSDNLTRSFLYPSMKRTHR
jgi:hypothetical protein